MDPPERIVIVGGGQAAGTVAQTLRAEGYAGSLAMVCGEARRPYERPPLSKAVLLGTATPESTSIFDDAAWDGLALALHPGVTATGFDRAQQCVSLSTGGSIGYDRLVIATGGRPRRLRIPGAEAEGVAYLRTLADSLALGRRLRSAKHLLVVGGGWIGLEVASSARSLGLAVTVLEADARLCRRGAPPVLSDFLLALHRRHGVDLRLGAALTSFAPRPGGGVTASCADGTAIDADLAVVGIGIVPNDELARAAGLECGDGVLTDPLGRTSDPLVFACGDVARFVHPGWSEPAMRIESWANAQQQGAACARALLGQPVRHAEVPWFWSDQFGINIQIMGAPDAGVAPIQRGDGDKMSLFWLRQGRLAAAVSIDLSAGHDNCAPACRWWVTPPPALLADPAVDMRKLLRAAA